MNIKQSALDYHKYPQPGKLCVLPSKPAATQDDLTLAYSPGVAFPCEEIVTNYEAVYDYTIRGNTVAVITDGSAVLGLGNIGVPASIPVMEGKCVLLRTQAGINGIPLSINRTSIDEFITTVSNLEHNFGAINLEDIKAPECFEIEKRLQEKMNIPVFHDDQHGTAIIILAALTNSLELVGKKLTDIRIVINGSGAAGIATAELLLASGVKREQMVLVDSEGIIYSGRTGLNTYKKPFATETAARSLSDAMKGSDVFIGVSKANILTESMVKSMNNDSIVFALANPIPEVMPERAVHWGAKIIAVGRSDYANQVNNVLGFPGIFRGALDCRASHISLRMKLSAADAIAQLTHEPIPDDLYTVLRDTYKKDFDRELSLSYIIPKPFDARVVPRVARAVVVAAMEEGIAKKRIKDINEYENIVSIYD